MAAVFIGHFEEDEVGELLEVVAVADAIIAQGVAEAPDSGDDRVGGIGHCFLKLRKRQDFL